MRIAHLLAPAPVGGLEAVVGALATGHRAMGLEPIILGTLSSPTQAGTLADVLKAGGVPAHWIAPSARRYDQEFKHLRRLLTDASVDVVHTHGYRSDVVGGIVARRLGLPVVSTVHGFTGGGWRNRMYERIQLFALARAGAVIAVSDSVSARLKESGVPEDRIEIIPNVWAGAQPLPREVARKRLGMVGTEPQLGWVGRLSHEKGVDLLLTALAGMRSVPWQLSLCGDGQERGRLEILTNRLGLQGRVRLLGIIPKAGEMFAAFDVFVLPSRTEGTPIVLLEAIGAGVPVVAAAVGGVPALLRADEGYLVPPEDPVALSLALREALENPEEALRRAQRARRRLPASGYEDWLARYRQVYCSLLGGPDPTVMATT